MVITSNYLPLKVVSYLVKNSLPDMEIFDGKPAYKPPKDKKSPKDNRGLICSTTAYANTTTAGVIQ